MSEIVETIRTNLRVNLTDSSAYEVAKNAVEIFEREADGPHEQLEYDFHIQHGQMHVDEAYAERNCWFKFDVKRGTAMERVKRAMYEADCNVLELKFINEFMEKVCVQVKQYFAGRVEAVLRKAMFKGKDVPLKLERVSLIEIIDFSHLRPEENVQLLVKKEVPKGVLEDYGAGQVSHQLFAINAQTGKIFADIIAERKAAGDTNYQYVVGVEVRKMLWEGQMDMFVNFLSLTPEEEAKGLAIRGIDAA